MAPITDFVSYLQQSSGQDADFSMVLLAHPKTSMMALVLAAEHFELKTKYADARITSILPTHELELDAKGTCRFFGIEGGTGTAAFQAILEIGETKSSTKSLGWFAFIF